MEFIRARLGDVVHHRAAVPPVLGAVLGNDLDLGDCIGISKKHVRTADIGIVVGLAVKLKVVVAISDSVGGKLGSVVVGKDVTAGGSYSRCEQRNDVEPVPNGKILRFLGVELLADLNGVWLKKRCRCLHRDGRLRSPDLNAIWPRVVAVPAWTRTLSILSGVNPAASTVTVYIPTGRPGICNAPAEFVVVLKGAFVDFSVAVTVAPCTTAELGSRTVPMIEPVTIPCPRHTPEEVMTMATNASLVMKRGIARMICSIRQGNRRVTQRACLSPIVPVTNQM